MQNDLSAIHALYRIDNSIATAGQPTQDQLHAIKNVGFEAVINLALPASDNALLSESSVVTELGMIYTHIPVDFKNPTEPDFRAFCGIMDALKGRRIFVHCAANKRVSAFLFLYRVLSQHVETVEAERDLKAVWQPDEIWNRFVQERLSRSVQTA